MNTRLNDDSVKTAMDQKGETIWYAVEVSDVNIMYQQNNISDFSLIGSKYVCTDFAHYTTSINRIDIMNGTLYLMFYSLNKHLFAKIDASTQKVIKIYETRSVYEYNHRDLLAKGGYLNIFNYRRYSQKRIVHNQVTPGSDIDFIPRYTETKDVTFERIVNSYFDFRNETLGSYDITYRYTYSDTNNSTHVKVEIKASEANSYIISLPESLEKKFVVDPNQTLIENIDLPCSLAFGGLNYTILDNETSKKPDWVTIDYSSLQISMQTPDVNETTKFSFVVSTQYLDGFLNNTINIIVTPCTALEHCKE